MGKYVAVHFDKIANIASAMAQASTKQALMNKLPMDYGHPNEYGAIEIFTEQRAKKEIEKYNKLSHS